MASHALRDNEDKDDQEEEVQEEEEEEVHEWSSPIYTTWCHTEASNMWIGEFEKPKTWSRTEIC